MPLPAANDVDAAPELTCETQVRCVAKAGCALATTLAGIAKTAKELAAGKALIAFLISPAARPEIEASGMQFLEKK